MRGKKGIKGHKGKKAPAARGPKKGWGNSHRLGHGKDTVRKKGTLERGNTRGGKKLSARGFRKCQRDPQGALFESAEGRDIRPKSKGKESGGINPPKNLHAKSNTWERAVRVNDEKRKQKKTENKSNQKKGRTRSKQKRIGGPQKKRH